MKGQQLARAETAFTAYHSVSDTGDNTRNDELTETPVRAESGNTDNGANDHDETTDQHHPPSSESFTNEEGNQGTEECTTEGNESAHKLAEKFLGYTYTSYTAVTVP